MDIEKQPTETTTDGQGVVSLPALATELLAAAESASAGRAARTLVPGAGAQLKQTVMALTAGAALADHDSPGAATLQVLKGTVRLSAGQQEVQLDVGDYAAIPPTRHGLVAVDDAVVLITVAQQAAGAP
jgi:quercetin dioxygenase-like cupin family protein